jgi:hypothetical protein
MTRQLNLDADKLPDMITWTATCSRGQDKHDGNGCEGQPHATYEIRIRPVVSGAFQ